MSAIRRVVKDGWGCRFPALLLWGLPIWDNLIDSLAICFRYPIRSSAPSARPVLWWPPRVCSFLLPARTLISSSSPGCLFLTSGARHSAFWLTTAHQSWVSTCPACSCKSSSASRICFREWTDLLWSFEDPPWVCWYTAPSSWCPGTWTIDPGGSRTRKTRSSRASVCSSAPGTAASANCLWRFCWWGCGCSSSSRRTWRSRRVLLCGYSFMYIIYANWSELLVFCFADSSLLLSAFEHELKDPILFFFLLLLGLFLLSRFFLLLLGLVQLDGDDSIDFVPEGGAECICPLGCALDDGCLLVSILR